VAAVVTVKETVAAVELVVTLKELQQILQLVLTLSQSVEADQRETEITLMEPMVVTQHSKAQLQTAVAVAVAVALALE
jgi:tellurite resistance protein